MIRLWGTMKSADYCGVTEASFRSRKLPEPDGVIEELPGKDGKPKERKGWKPSTIMDWNAKYYGGKVRVPIAKCAPSE